MSVQNYAPLPAVQRSIPLIAQGRDDLDGPQRRTDAPAAADCEPGAREIPLRAAGSARCHGYRAARVVTAGRRSPWAVNEQRETQVSLRYLPFLPARRT